MNRSVHPMFGWFVGPSITSVSETHLLAFFVRGDVRHQRKSSYGSRYRLSLAHPLSLPRALALPLILALALTFALALALAPALASTLALALAITLAPVLALAFALALAIAIALALALILALAIALAVCSSVPHFSDKGVSRGSFDVRSLISQFVYSPIFPPCIYSISHCQRKIHWMHCFPIGLV